MVIIEIYFIKGFLNLIAEFIKKSTKTEKRYIKRMITQGPITSPSEDKRDKGDNIKIRIPLNKDV